MKKISVIIPTYNSENYINECIDSVINQTYKNLEIIIIDDKSIDNTVSIVKKYQDKRIKLIELPNNSGVAIARNEGIKQATGSYICFIDSDDIWYKDKIKKQVKFIKNKEFIYSGYEFFNGKNKHEVHVPKSINYKQALKNTTIFTSTVMFNMKYLSKEDIYMPNLRRGQDTACWWKVLKKIDKAYGINEVLATYRVGKKSLSHNKINALKRTWNLYNIENLNIFKKIFCFTCYVINALKRRI